MSFDLSELKDLLKDANKEATGSGVSFANRSLKLDTEEDASQVVKAIQACPVLEYLDLSGNTLGPLAAKAVAEALKVKGASLKRALWKDMFTGRLKTEIPQALEYLGSALCAAGTRLVELDLSDNAFGPIGIRGLANFLTSSTCYTLQELRLNNNGLGISGAEILAQALLKCHENSSKHGTPLALKVFVAGRNRLENDGAEALAAVFKKLTTLEEVSIPQNGIYYRGIAELARGLSANPGLRVLNLNDNTVGPQGAEVLAKALPNFQNLEQLNLGDCLLRTKGCVILAKALGEEGHYPSLAVVNLSYNEIKANGAKPIALAMADKEMLHTLQLNGNDFGAKGRAILRSTLTECNRIKSLKSESDEGKDDDDEDFDNVSDDDDDDDDEDEDEDDDDEDDDEDDEEDDEEDDDDDEEGENDNVTENGNETLGPKVHAKVSIAEFLKSPTGEKLLLLQSSNIDDFVEHAKNSCKCTDVSELKFVEEYTRIIMKVSQHCGSGYMNVRLKATSVTDGLYAKLSEFAAQNNQISVWNNALLVNLDLIKSEDKRSGRIDWNLEGCFKALEKVCQKDYFPAQIRHTLKFFLEKPIKIKKANVDPFQESKDSLRTVLNGIQAT